MGHRPVEGCCLAALSGASTGSVPARELNAPSQQLPASGQSGRSSSRPSGSSFASWRSKRPLGGSAAAFQAVKHKSWLGFFFFIAAASF